MKTDVCHWKKLKGRELIDIDMNDMEKLLREQFRLKNQ